MHGGKSLAGPAAPAWIDGRRSHVLPKRLLDDYRASLDDPDRLVLNAEIALVDSRLNDVLKRVDSGESGAIWSQIKQVWGEFEDADAIGDKDARAQAQFRLGTLIVRGANDWMAWADVLGLIERRRKLVESERKRLVEAQQMIHVEQAMALLGLLVDAVRRHVDSDDTLGAIVDEYARLTGRPGPVAAPPAIPARDSARRGAG